MFRWRTTVCSLGTSSLNFHYRYSIKVLLYLAFDLGTLLLPQECVHVLFIESLRQVYLMKMLCT